MTTELTTTPGGWLAFKEVAEGLPAPFGRDIVLAEIEVAGTDRVESITYKTEKLTCGDELRAVREPENKFDSRAIRLETGTGVTLGYVPRRINDMPGRLMDAGKLLVVRVASREVVNHYVRIRGELVLREI